jgi:hypothetical protein
VGALMLREKTFLHRSVLLFNMQHTLLARDYTYFSGIGRTTESDETFDLMFKVDEAKRMTVEGLKKMEAHHDNGKI